MALRRLRCLRLTALVSAAVVIVAAGCDSSDPVTTLPDATGPRVGRPDRLVEPRRFSSNNVTIWWDHVPDPIRRRSADSGVVSNIRPGDYVGPESCRKCHRDNHDDWSQHPHRWMNALANEASVLGDFSGRAVMLYQGGRTTFFRERTEYRMRLTRGDLVREYAIHQTIGSRFYQYYVGMQVEGPEPATHKFYHEDHVLPFGYWIGGRRWVPVVHVGAERPDHRRFDPYASPATGMPDYADYSLNCNYCHTTFAFGDMMLRQPQLIGHHVPLKLNLWTSAYVAKSHPELFAPSDDPTLFPDAKLQALSDTMRFYAAANQGVTLGISCEACHLGAREHVENPKILPRFFPAAPELLVENDGKPLDYGRTHDNVNYACGRCHAGKRREFASGAATWNSIEFNDAKLGNCYSQLKCIDCHDPHRATGQRWTRTPQQDDASCLRCHDRFEPAEARLAHTHHPAGSTGSRCMNCHMPRINEGLQDVVRTHMIYSPTRADMIEANHPNACNLCHADRSIEWTLARIEQWYGTTYSRKAIDKNYLRPDQPAALGWLTGSNEAVRLVAADALARTRSDWALGQLIESLDDPYLLNRQFTALALERNFGLNLSDIGYRYFMTPDERRQPLQQLRTMLSGSGSE